MVELLASRTYKALSDVLLQFINKTVSSILGNRNRQHEENKNTEHRGRRRVICQLHKIKIKNHQTWTNKFIQSIYVHSKEKPFAVGGTDSNILVSGLPAIEVVLGEEL